MLPPRQFNKSSHWLEFKQPPQIAQIESGSPNATDHPSTIELWSFAGFNDAVESSAKFRINTDVPDWDKYTSGHIIAQEAPICPATLQIHIVVDAVQSLHPAFKNDTHRPIITSVSNQAPICIDPARSVWLNVKSNDQKKDHWNWKISSTDHQGNRGTIHVTGLISFRPVDDDEYLLDFARYSRLISHDRCTQLLHDLNPDETITGRNIYRAFSDVVDYGGLFRGLKKLVGKGTESAGRVVLQGNQHPWFDTVATDCFSQVGGIWVNCMTERRRSTLYITNGIQQWVQSPKARSKTEGPRSFDVFATHHKVSSKAYCTNVFVFDSQNGALSEVILGINYVEVSKVGMQRMLSKLTLGSGTIRQAASVPAVPRASVAIDLSPVSTPAPPPTYFTQDQSNSASPRDDTTYVSDKLKHIIGDLCGLEKHKIRDDAQLADLGVDSLMSMELLREIETAFKITVPADDRVEVVDLPSLVTGISSLVCGISTPDSYNTEPDSPSASDATSVSSEDETSGLQLDGGEWLAAFAEMNIDTDSCIAEYGFAGYLGGVDIKQTELCIYMILEALEKLGRGLTTVAPGAILQRVDHIAEHKRLVDYLY